MSDQEIDALVAAARAVRDRAHAPYSRYKVAAALRAEDGRVFTGVNVENAAFPTSMCAERNALGAAVTSGATRFVAVAVVTELDGKGQPGSPCGACRQALSEFGLELDVHLAGPDGPAHATLRLSDLLPAAFSGDAL